MDRPWSDREGEVALDTATLASNGKVVLIGRAVVVAGCWHWVQIEKGPSRANEWARCFRSMSLKLVGLTLFAVAACMISLMRFSIKLVVFYVSCL